MLASHLSSAEEPTEIEDALDTQSKSWDDSASDEPSDLDHQDPAPVVISPPPPRVPRGMPPAAVPDKDKLVDGKRVRACRNEFKRLDELYNKYSHTYYLAETESLISSKEDVWEEYAFVVRRLFDWQNQYRHARIEIKSPRLRDIIRETLKSVSGINLAEDKPKIDPNLLYVYLPRFSEQLEQLKDDGSETATHLRLFVQYLTEEYMETSLTLEAHISKKTISYDLLWAILTPNTLLLSKCPGSNEPRCFRLDLGQEIHTTQRNFFQMECTFVEWDGAVFGETKGILEIDKFEGVRAVTSLPAYPLSYHNEKEQLRKELLERAEKFCALGRGDGNDDPGCYRMYKGLAFILKKNEYVKFNIEGRIMVDSVAFRQVNANYKTSFFEKSPTRRSRYGAPDMTLDQFCDRSMEGNINSAAGPEDDVRFDDDGEVIPVPENGSSTNIKSASRKSKDGDAGLKPESMTEEQLLICTATVLGFCFTEKIWVELGIDHISPIEWNTTAYDSLVLPEAKKKILKALVQSHILKGKQTTPVFDDVIKGKGRGLVVVLHGKPGVGKTLTAESISELLKRPLYMIGAGELSTSAQELEIQLAQILNTAYRWGALILLDEADVFLEKRNMHELARNALVSVFLRLLEYFRGIIFLTTNRVESFDEAFQSRIHIALRYSDLDRRGKCKVWKNFLAIATTDEVSTGQKSGPMAGGRKKIIDADSFTEDDFETLSKRNLNGRQIKNAVMTAQALAINEGRKLNMEHIHTVLDVVDGFDHDLNGTGQIDGMMSYA